MRGDANSLALVEEMLENLKVSESLSNTQLKEVVRERGICLRDGVEYGPELKAKLRSKKGKQYKVHLEEAIPPLRRSARSRLLRVRAQKIM